ncbi:hypothetical protein DBV15_12227 [Temnothorax longispinosus]|uniref:Uncharacterized protein n=1 Tax=Temnothorax longispinosus TaxID=300112 RepID=A0A4S2KCP2_9HYME|nr:hypothetical protein DBV15_12227 [Temnothorax longispinosus]
MGGSRVRLSARIVLKSVEKSLRRLRGAYTRRTLWPRKEPASRPYKPRENSSPVRQNSTPLFPDVCSPASFPAARAGGEAKRRNTGRASSSVLTLQLGLPWDSFAAQRKRYSRGDEEPLRVGAKPLCICETTRTRFGQRHRHENGSFQRNEIGLTMMGLYPLVSKSSWMIQPMMTIVMTESR